MRNPMQTALTQKCLPQIIGAVIALAFTSLWYYFDFSPKFAAVIVLMFAFLVLAARGTRSIFWLLQLLVFMIPLGRVMRLSSSDETILPMVGIVVALYWFFWRFVQERKTLTWVKNERLLVPFLLLLLASCFLGQDLKMDLRSFATYFQCVVFMHIIAVEADSIKKLKFLAWTLIISLTLSSVVILWYGYHLPGYEAIRPMVEKREMKLHSYDEWLGEGYFRAGSFIGDPNFTALQVLPVLAFLFYFFFIYRKIWIRVLLGVCALVNVLVIFSSVSISALISTAVTLLFTYHVTRKFVRFRFRTSKALVYILSIGLLGASVWIVQTKNPYFTYRLSVKLGLLEAGRTADFTSGRSEIYSSAAKELILHPILGVGVSRLNDVVGRNVTFSPSVGTHNTFLYVGIEGGGICFVLFVVFIYKTLRQLYRSIRECVPIDQKQMVIIGCALLVASVSFLVMGQTVSAPKIKYLWLLLGMAIAYSRIVDTRTRKHSMAYHSHEHLTLNT